MFELSIGDLIYNTYSRVVYEVVGTDGPWFICIDQRSNRVILPRFISAGIGWGKLL